MGKYDETLYRYLEDKERFADLFNGLCFGGKMVVQPEELEELSEREAEMGDHSKGTSIYRDLKKRWKQGGCLRILAAEHQAKVDYTMPWRIMSMDCSEYGKQIRRIKRRNKKEKACQSPEEVLCGMKKTDRLNPVYTLCLYHGEKPWNGPRSLKDMMEFGESPFFFHDYTMTLVSANEIADPKVFRTSLRELFKILPLRKDRSRIKQLLEEDPNYRQLDRETLETIGVMIHQPSLVEKINEYEEKEGVYNMCLAFEEEREEGRKEGRLEGRKEGHRAGRREGRRAGRREGRREEKRFVIRNMYKENFTIEQIGRATGCSTEEIQQTICK